VSENFPCETYRTQTIDTFHGRRWTVSGVGDWLAKKDKGKTYRSSDVERS